MKASWIVCRYCGRNTKPGRRVIHLSGDCMKPWQVRLREQHSRGPGRPPEPDLPPELIERIMARRAREQRYERALAQGATEA